MGKRITYTEGQKVGNLIFLREVNTTKRDRRAEFLCGCGKITETFINSVVSLHIRSCGCGRVDASRKTHRTHGKTKTVEHRTWSHIRQRCINPNDGAYKYYGARGIAICERWNSFENFLEDMGLRPAGSYSIERDDVDGPYSPENCRWATGVEQANNKTNNFFLNYNGEKLSITQWARRFGIKMLTLRFRIKKGWSIEKALTTPVRKMTYADI